MSNVTPMRPLEAAHEKAGAAPLSAGSVVNTVIQGDFTLSPEMVKARVQEIFGDAPNNAADTDSAAEIAADPNNTPAAASIVAPEPDDAAILCHVNLIHDRAQAALAVSPGASGIFLLVAIVDGRTPRVARFLPGDAANMAALASDWAREPATNVYISLALFRTNTRHGSTGRIQDVGAVLGLVVDQDTDKGESAQLPMAPSYAVETSKGNFQFAYLLERPLGAAEAEPLARGLTDAAGCDRRGLDTSSLWRLAGTLNHPSKTKRDRGRPETPFLTRFTELQDGPLIDPDDLAAAIERSPKPVKARVPAKAAGQVREADWTPSSATDDDLLARVPASLQQRLAKPAERGEDRSATAFGAMRALIDQEFSADELARLIALHPAGVGERYLEGKDLRRDIARAFEKHVPRRGASAYVETEVLPPGPGSRGLMSEDECAQRFTAQYAGTLRFDHTVQAWFEFRDGRWHRDRVKAAFHFAREVSRGRGDGRAAFAGGVERLARSAPELAVTGDDWDADPLLLGTPAGTYDMRTHEMRPADPNDHITRSTGAVPEHGEPTRWLRFLCETFAGDQRIIGFLRAWAGYCCSGLTAEHKLLVAVGSGGNGKSVFLNTLRRVFGDYAMTAPAETFAARRNDAHTEEIARLRGARLVVSSETQAGLRWNEARLKALTGGDAVVARKLYENSMEFTPQFKLTFATNYLPELSSVDEALRRRILVVRFGLKPAVPDPGLEDALMAEAPQILSWALQGFADYRTEGLALPEAVVSESDRYMTEQDLFASWLSERCDVVGQARTSSAALLSSWNGFLAQHGEARESSKALAGRLSSAGFQPARTSAGKGWCGLRLRHTSPEALAG